MKKTSDIIIAGIDYSMTSPALCIGPIGAEFKDCEVHCFGTKKQQFTWNNIYITAYPEYNTQEERFFLLAHWASEILAKYSDNEIKVFIEGYAFGSKAGQVFQIGENTGVLKSMLWKNSYEFDVVAPTSVKKFATGKGNAKKEFMYTAFCEETDTDIQSILAPKAEKIGNPVGDIVDAYYIHGLGSELTVYSEAGLETFE